MKKHIKYILPLVLVAIVVLGLAGWRAWGTDKGLDGEWPKLEGGVYTDAVTRSGLKYLVPPDEVYASGLGSEDRPALTNPDMVSIAAADAKLADDLEGIAVSVGGEHRFYPFQVLNWHEVVNAKINGRDLVITYSPISGSAVVFEDDRVFSDAGKIYNNGMLIQANGDESSLWNQTTGQAIVGQEVGEHLTIFPSTVMSWSAWKDLYPSGLSLSTDTGYTRDYGRHPYASYETSPGIFFPMNYSFGKLSPKDLVHKVELEGLTKSIIFMQRYLPLQSNPNVVAETSTGNLNLAALYDEDTEVVRVYKAEANGRMLTFVYTGGKITDQETGSVWSPLGVALSGELAGAVLEAVPTTRHYAFVYFAMYPETLISGEDLLPTNESEPEGEVLEVY